MLKSNKNMPEGIKTVASKPGPISSIVKADEAAGEFEVKCPLCGAPGLVSNTYVACLNCKVKYIEFTHVLTPRKRQQKQAK